MSKTRLAQRVLANFKCEPIAAIGVRHFDRVAKAADIYFKIKA